MDTEELKAFFGYSQHSTMLPRFGHLEIIDTIVPVYNDDIYLDGLGEITVTLYHGRSGIKVSRIVNVDQPVSFSGAQIPFIRNVNYDDYDWVRVKADVHYYRPYFGDSANGRFLFNDLDVALKTLTGFSISLLLDSNGDDIVDDSESDSSEDDDISRSSDKSVLLKLALKLDYKLFGSNNPDLMTANVGLDDKSDSIRKVLIAMLLILAKVRRFFSYAFYSLQTGESELHTDDVIQNWKDGQVILFYALIIVFLIILFKLIR
jgi:hypothetical protein